MATAVIAIRPVVPGVKATPNPVEYHVLVLEVEQELNVDWNESAGLVVALTLIAVPTVKSDAASIMEAIRFFLFIQSPPLSPSA